MTKATPKSIRLLIIDDHVLFRESVARLLQSEPGLEVVAGCASSVEVLRILRSTKDIDVVLLDVDLGHEKGTDLLDLLRKDNFQGRVLLVTAGVNESELPALIRKGINGVFLKHGSFASLIQSIRDTMEGKALFDQDMLPSRLAARRRAYR
jgi:two-component system, NarL family, nitrate/nitrite response regulator NarL